MIPPPPRSTLFPYTTLFRSIGGFAQPPLRHAREEARAHGLAALVVGEHPFGQRRTEDRRPERVHGDADRKSTRLNSSHSQISYAVFCLKKKNTFLKTVGYTF